MFGFKKTLDVITLFHKPSLQSSMRALTLLKQASAQASETSTEDQAADHSHQNKAQRSDFELEISEAPPTQDQLRSIFEWLGDSVAGELVKGATNQADAMRKLKQDGENFKRPVVVDWNNGNVVIGDKESQIIKLANELPK